MSLKMRYTLHEAAEKIGLEPDTIIRFVSYEWIDPVEWGSQLLDEEDIARARLILELQENFGVNEEAVPVILHLIDQLSRASLDLKKLTKDD